MKFKLMTRNMTKPILALSMLLFSNTLFAEVQLCLIKEVSDDGINYEDANTEAEAVLINNNTAYFRFTASQCDDRFWGFDTLTLTDQDLALSDEPIDAILNGNDVIDAPLDQSRQSVYTYTLENACTGIAETHENTATVNGIWNFDYQTTSQATDNAWFRCDTPVTGGEGCTPGYWKQPHHLDSWGEVQPTTLFSEVFEREITIRIKGLGEVTDPTLLQALSAKGGKVNMAARHAVAAYLNAMNANVAYDLTALSIIDAFQSSFDENNFGTVIENLVNFNEQGCTLN